MQTRGSAGPFFVGVNGPVGRARQRRRYEGSVGQHQEGEGKQEAQQNEQEGADAPDGRQDADYFVFARLWFHKN